MHAKKKLQEAYFFLARMRELEDQLELKAVSSFPKEGTEVVFTYFLDAFLSSWASVLDIIRYDFAEKYRVGITRDERVEERTFKWIASFLRERGEGEFSRFLDWLTEQETALEERHGVLFEKRKKIVHREFVRARRGYRRIERTYTVDISRLSSAGVSAIITGRDLGRYSAEEYARGKIALTEKPKRFSYWRATTPDFVLSRPKKEPIFCFEENKTISAVDICETAYHDMSKLTDQAEREIWRSKA